MSVNHQFIHYSDKVVKRFTKTVPYNVSGYRLNPHKPEERIDFMLSTPEKNFDYTEKRVNAFTYEDEVLELYSETEVNLFNRLNKAAIEAGLLKEYHGEGSSINEANFLSDEEVNRIASLKLPVQVRKQLESINSIISVQRILETAKSNGRAYTVVRVIENRLNELQNANS